MIFSSDPPKGYVADHTDCNDSDASINPAAREICDSIDNNCDDQIDEGCPTCTENDADTYAVEGGSCGQVDWNDDVYIGRHYNTLKDDETGREFKNSVENTLKKIVNEFECYYVDVAYYDG